MSSILRALKKLEGESSDTTEAASAVGTINTKKAVNKRLKGFWLTRRITAVLIMLVLLLLLGALVFTQRGLFYRETQRPDPRSAPVEAAKKAPIKKTPVVTAPPARTSAMGKTRPGHLPGSPSAKGASMPLRAKGPAQEETPSSFPVDDRISGSETPGSVKPIPPESKTRISRQAIKPAVTEKPLDISNFKLEAIVWASEPGSRFAVINGQIVRAGSSMKGVNIKEIGRDHVALESGGREGRLKFRVE